MTRFLLPPLLALSAAACAAVPGGLPPATALVGTEWLLEDLPGLQDADRVRATLAFPERGRVAGHGGCNRFGGEAGFDGASVRFARLVATRRACAPAVMAQERLYLTALEAAERVAVDGDVLRVFSGATAQPLRFGRIR